MQKRNLTPEKICEVAIKLIESEGLEGLSMRKLAANLNIEAASLYNHIANKAALFDLVQEHLYSQMVLKAAKQDWRGHLFELANCTRKSLLTIPNIVPLFATRPTVTPSSLAQIEKTLTILVNAGFKHSEVTSIYTNLHVFILGHVLAQVGHVPGESDSSNEPSLQQINMDQYPTLKKAYLYKSSSDFDKGFRLGIESMLSGLDLVLKLRKKR